MTGGVCGMVSNGGEDWANLSRLKAVSWCSCFTMLGDGIVWLVVEVGAVAGCVDGGSLALGVEVAGPGWVGGGVGAGMLVGGRKGEGVTWGVHTGADWQYGATGI